MRQRLRQCLLIIICLFTFLASGLASQALAGVVVKCVVPKAKVGKVCIIKTRFGDKGDRVIIKDRHLKRYWKATGVIVQDKGLYSVVVFQDSKEHITRGDYAEIEAPTAIDSYDWKSSFSNHDYF